MPVRDREPYRLAIAQLSDAALAALLERESAEAERLAVMLERDRAALADDAPRGPVGKLRPRISRTQSRWMECLARRSAAERESEKRAMFRALAWDEPTLPDLEPCSG